MMRSGLPLVVTLEPCKAMENLISSGNFQQAWNLIVQEIAQDPEGKEELKELFSFILTTYW